MNIYLFTYKNEYLCIYKSEYKDKDTLAIRSPGRCLLDQTPGRIRGARMQHELFFLVFEESAHMFRVFESTNMFRVFEPTSMLWVFKPNEHVQYVYISINYILPDKISTREK